MPRRRARSSEAERLDEEETCTVSEEEAEALEEACRRMDAGEKGVTVKQMWRRLRAKK